MTVSKLIATICLATITALANAQLLQLPSVRKGLVTHTHVMPPVADTPTKLAETIDNPYGVVADTPTKLAETIDNPYGVVSAGHTESVETPVPVSSTGSVKQPPVVPTDDKTESVETPVPVSSDKTGPVKEPPVESIDDNDPSAPTTTTPSNKKTTQDNAMELFEASIEQDIAILYSTMHDKTYGKPTTEAIKRLQMMLHMVATV
jgi:hypothetical protein